MFEPSFEQFLLDQKQFHTIPIVYQFYADAITPIQIFHAFQEDAVFMLESNDDESTWSNFSFIGMNPIFSIFEQNQTFIMTDRQNHEMMKSKRLSSIFEQMERHLNVKKPNLNIPFIGGAVGNIGYEAVSIFDKVPEHEHSQKDKTKCEFIVCETIIAYDHHKKQISFIHYVSLTGLETLEQLKLIYEEAISRLKKFEQTLLHDATRFEQTFFPSVEAGVSFESIQSNYTKEQFKEAVEQVKEYIRAGDIFQAVLSQRFEKEVTVSAFDLYRVLRIVNPSPYMFYMKLTNEELVGSSPERLIHVQNNHLEIHPIAGTRRRGRSKEEDEQLGQNLLNDEKELAEHYMLVDLARNDIGKVSKYGSVQTPVLVQLTYFSHVMHLISKVTGRLKDDVHPIDALISSFPAGTVSGAPKIRAMQIINELEPQARGSYAGCIAYIGFDGNIDSCITIRTISLKHNKACVQAGAGIVADSVPEMEWRETRNKASALIKTIEVAELSFSKKGANTDARNIEKVY